MHARITIALISIFVALPSAAIDLSPGDVLVTGTPDGQPAGLYHVDPTTEVATLVSAGAFVDFDRIDDTVFALEGGDTVVEINTETGASQAISAAGLMVDAVGIAAPTEERVFVLQADPADPNSSGQIIEVDRFSGAQSILTEGSPLLGTPLFHSVYDLESSESGNLIVLSHFLGSASQIFEVAIDSGEQRNRNAMGQSGEGATALSVGADRRIYVADGQFRASGMAAYDPGSGTVSRAGALLMAYEPPSLFDAFRSDIAIQLNGYGYAVSQHGGLHGLLRLVPYPFSPCSGEVCYSIGYLQNVVPTGDETLPVPLSRPMVSGFFSEVQVVPEICALVGGLDCVDADSCTLDSCDPSLGCVHTEDPHPSCADRVNTADTRKCTVTLAKKTLLSSGMLGKQNQDSEACIKDFGKEKLGALSPDQCLLDDRKDRVQKAEDRATKVDGSKCSDPEQTPAYAYTGASTASQSAVAESLAMTEDVLGGPLLDLLATKTSDRDEQACQLDVTKRAGNLLEEMLKTALNEENEVLKTSTINSSAELAPALLAAIDTDSKGRIAKKRSVVDTKLTKLCVDKGVTLAEAFQGACAGDTADVPTFGSCVEARARCHACHALSGAHGFAFTCDGFDDGDAVNSSCL